MATIKDIAKLAKVSQGTVSNVLNQKENVSSEKIERVLKAAEKLDYIPNYSAKSLRKGFTNQLHLILPNISSQAYTDVYHSFKKYAKDEGLNVNLMVSDDNKDLEIDLINRLLPEINSNMKIAVITSVPFGEEYPNLPPAALDNIVFLIKDYVDSRHFISFDFSKAGKTLAKQIDTTKSKNICVLSNLVPICNEIKFREAVEEELSSHNVKIKSIKVDPLRKHQSILEYINNKNYDAFLLPDFEFAKILQEIIINFSKVNKTLIYVVSPLFVIPETEFIKYELNYRLLGHIAAEEMISDKLSVGHIVLKGNSIRNWLPETIEQKMPTIKLKILTVDNPSAYILKKLSIQYYKVSNVEIEVDIKDYNQVFEILSNKQRIKEYDVIRNDVNWMSWFSDDIFMPLNIKDSRIEKLSTNIIDGLLEEYMIQNNVLYALPFSPSTQVLFYRKDLFERFDIKRQFKEMYNEDLTLPTDFESFNLVAKFFTKKFNSNSPTDFGATLTLGNTGVAGSEFLSRYFAQKNRLYDKNGRIHFSNTETKTALKQIRELKQFTDPNYCNWWTDTAQAFAKGNVAMAIMYSNYASELLSFNSNVVNRIGQAPVPGNNPLMGGGALGIAKYSKHEKVALDFITWIASETVSSSGSLLGNLPSHKETLKLYEILDMYPWYAITEQGIKNSQCYRVPPSSNVKFNEKGMLKIIGRATINTYLDDNLKIEEVQEKTQKLLDQAHDSLHK